jgi:hypothetical protein
MPLGLVSKQALPKAVGLHAECDDGMSYDLRAIIPVS